MVVSSAGEVVLVSFPFSDLSASKVRPAVCLAAADRGDWILCQITSQPYADSSAVILEKSDFASGALRLTSFARPGKLFTANDALIRSSIGMLSSSSFDKVLFATISLLKRSARSA